MRCNTMIFTGASKYRIALRPAAVTQNDCPIFS
jgi:hypothetical protein